MLDPTFILHPLGYCQGTPHQQMLCKGYNLWSGIAGSFVTSTGIYAGVYIFWRKHNCHVHGCWRLQWHPHPENGHPLCRRHHPHDPREIANERD